MFIFDHVTVIEYQSAVVYQISSKSDDFSLRYVDFTIFKMAEIRRLEFECNVAIETNKFDLIRFETAARIIKLCSNISLISPIRWGPL